MAVERHWLHWPAQAVRVLLVLLFAGIGGLFAPLLLLTQPPDGVLNAGLFGAVLVIGVALVPRAPAAVKVLGVLCCSLPLAAAWAGAAYGPLFRMKPGDDRLEPLAVDVALTLAALALILLDLHRPGPPPHPEAPPPESV